MAESPHANQVGPQPPAESVMSLKALIGWVRRCHLYLGLFLAPWALLYGITGYLFNHPTHFSDRGLKEISRATLVAAGFDGTLTPPHEAALEVVSKMNERFPDANLELAEDHDAQYLGDFFFATASGSRKTYQLLIRRDGGGGTYLDSTPPPKPAERKAPFMINPQSGTLFRGGQDQNAMAALPIEPLKMTRSSASVVESILPELANRLDLPGLDQPFRLTSAPQLQFRARYAGETWLVKYDSFRGSVNAEVVDPNNVQPPLSWRASLLRLHTTHGYSGIYEARWFWAMMVDAMAGVLIFWSISGLVMWWQIKRLRAIGLVVIALSLLVAGGLFWAMASELGANRF